MRILARPTTRLVALAVAAAITLSGCGFHGLYGTNLPGGADVGDHPYTLTAYFDNVLDLVPQSAVKVNDVPVGRVQSVDLTSKNDQSGDKATNGWTAKVEFLVNSDVKMPENSRAMIKQTSLLGEKYVDLEQPITQPAKTDLGNGDTIPITRTGSAPETEEVLGALSLLLNGGGLQQIKIITTELNKALNGNEGAIRDLLTQLNTFVGTLDSQKAQIIASLESVNRLAVTLNDNKQKIIDALDHFPKALEILKNNRTKLTTMLVALSHLGDVATRVITKTQQNFVSSLKSLAPAVEQLAASGSNLVNSLKIAGTFPFPLGTTLQAVRGDYANLNAFLDLNLSDQLCGLNKQLCTVVKTVLPQSKSATKQGGSSATTPQSAQTSPLPSSPLDVPSLLGVGG